MQRKIFLLVVSCILCILASVGVISYLSVKKSIEHSFEGQLNLATAISRNIDYILESNITRLYDISTFGVLDIEDNDWEPERNALKSAYEYSVFSDGLFLMNAYGDVVMTYPHKDEGNINILGLPFISEAFEKKKLVVSDVYTSAETKRSVIFVLVPLKDARGNVTGMLGGELNPMNYLLTSAIKSVQLDRSSVIEIVDSKGTVIASNSSERILSRSDHNKFLEKLISKKESFIGTCHRCHLEGSQEQQRKTDMLAFVPLSLAPWGVAIRDPEEVVFAPTRNLQKAFAIISVIIIAVAVVLSVGLSKSIAEPLTLLTGWTGKIARGDMDSTIDIRRNDEIGTLAKSFDSMRIKLAESYKALTDQNVNLEKVVAERTKELEVRKHQLTRLLDKGMKAQEDERRRIARELHDETGQTLAAMGMSLDISSIALETGELTPDMLMNLREKVGDIMDSINRIIQDLRPPVLDDLGIEPALSWLMKRHLETKGIDYVFDANGLSEKALGEKKELGLFRIVQEAVINTSKHSGASDALLQIKRHDSSIDVLIMDNGVGFDIEEVVQSEQDVVGLKGYGIMGMKERVAQLKGEMEIISAPHAGTSIAFNIPV